MATLMRVKYLRPHGKRAHSTYGVLSPAEAAKLEEKGIVQIRGVASDEDIAAAAAEKEA